MIRIVPASPFWDSQDADNQSLRQRQRFVKQEHGIARRQTNPAQIPAGNQDRHPDLPGSDAATISVAFTLVGAISFLAGSLLMLPEAADGEDS